MGFALAGFDNKRFQADSHLAYCIILLVYLHIAIDGWHRLQIQFVMFGEFYDNESQ